MDTSDKAIVIPQEDVRRTEVWYKLAHFSEATGLEVVMMNNLGCIAQTLQKILFKQEGFIKATRGYVLR
jgi:hypothetical protein